MESSRLSLAASVVFLSLALHPGTPNVAPSSVAPSARRLEVARLRAHFDSVDVELRQANVAHLTAAQRAARATLVGWLREYRDAGTFPQNDRFPDRSVPFFRDSYGVLCAMAYLIDRSGRGDIVEHVAATRNNGFIPELADDPELVAWLDSTGLSVGEAARIQPSYGPIPTPDDDAVSTDYAITSILVSGAALTTVGLNLIDPNRSTGWAGVLAGSAGIIAGAVNLDGSGGTDKVAAANMIVGSGAVALGVYRLVSTRPVGTSVTPMMSPTSGMGLAVHTSF
jgi:hypothetical protein